MGRDFTPESQLPHTYMGWQWLPLRIVKIWQGDTSMAPGMGGVAQTRCSVIASLFSSNGGHLWEITLQAQSLAMHYLIYSPPR